MNKGKSARSAKKSNAMYGNLHFIKFDIPIPPNLNKISFGVWYSIFKTLNTKYQTPNN